MGDLIFAACLRFPRAAAEQLAAWVKVERFTAAVLAGDTAKAELPTGQEVDMHTSMEIALLCSSSRETPDGHTLH